MNKVLVAVVLALPGIAFGWDGENQYGPGVHADRYGRAFQYETDRGKAVPGGVRVDPGGYGPGVGADEYGRPVRARGLDGRELEPFSVRGDE